MWSRPSYRIPVLVGLLTAVVAFAWTISTLSSSTGFQNQLLAGRSQYLAAQGDLHRGSVITDGDLKVSEVATTDNFRALYFGGSDRSSLVGTVALTDIAGGALIPRSSVARGGSTNLRRVAIAFKIAPELHTGDVVDVFIIEDPTQTAASGGNSTATRPFLSQVTLFGAGPPLGGWMVNVPADQATAVTYADENLKLAAVLDLPGSTATPISAVSSSSEAARRVGSQ